MGTALNVQAWDTTAANNDDADSSIALPEGMAPGGVNDAARGIMAAIAKLVDDLGGAIVAGGTGNAITLTTNQSLSAGQVGNGLLLAFRATANNSGATTVAVDGITAADLESQGGSALVGGEIISGGIYLIAYSSAASAYLLLNPGAVVSASSTTTFTNKTINASNNTLSNITVAMMAGAAIVTASETLASSDNDTSVPTTAAVIDAIAAVTLSVASASEIWAGSNNTKMITPAAMAAALTPTTLTRDSTTTVDFAAGINFNCAMDGNGTLAFGTITSAMVGRSGWIKFTQDGTGSRTMAFTSSTIDTINSEALVLSTAANAIDQVNYTILSTTKVSMFMARRLGT